MPSKSKKNSASKELGLFIGIFFLVIGIAGFIAISLMGVLFSWWLLLPLTLFMTSVFVIDHALDIVIEKRDVLKKLEKESEEDYQERQKLNAMLEKLFSYAQGERVEENNDPLYTSLKSAQKAHFMP